VFCTIFFQDELATNIVKRPILLIFLNQIYILLKYLLDSTENPELSLYQAV